MSMRRRNVDIRGGLAKVLAVFTANWGLKLLALALAIIIYLTLSNEGKTKSNHKSHEANIFQQHS